MVAAKQRVDAMLHNGEDYDHGNAVDCGKEVVGDSVRVHVGGLRDEVGGHLSLAEPVDYECDAIKKISASYDGEITEFVWAYKARVAVRPFLSSSMKDALHGTDMPYFLWT